MSAPKYVQRFARLPEVFERLTREPDGMSLRALADEFGIGSEELRVDLLSYYTADGIQFGLSIPPMLEFLSADGEEEDPAEAQVVRISSDHPADLGVEYVDAGELGLVYAAALALLEVEPDNADLAGALDVLAETMFGEPAGEHETPDWTRLLPLLRDAVEQRRAVRIVYSRAWEQGVRERVIEPHRLVQTRRGWEVDAGVPGTADLRTFLLSNIRSAELTGDTFERPDDIDEQIAANRATTSVTVVLPQESRWVADFYAEEVVTVRDDPDDVEVRLELLPPLERRLGLVLLAAPGSFVTEPVALQDVGAVLANELFWHHSG